MHETPLLIDVSDTTYESYLSSLSKSARKNHTYTCKQNVDLEFSRVSFSPEKVAEFMDLWEQQEAAGNSIQWGITKQFVHFLEAKGHLICYAAYPINNPDNPLAMHFVEKHGTYVECHPPMFDKQLYNERYLAKYMWFGLIRDAIADPGIRWLDLGGGNRGSWRDLLIHREEWSSSYKWMYVPKNIKEKPEEAPALYVKLGITRYAKGLTMKEQATSDIGKYLLRKYVVWRWLSQGNRLGKMRKKFVPQTNSASSP